MTVKAEKIWMDGKFVPWNEAKVHVLVHSLHYGLAAFEGIRCYACVDGRSAVFRLKEHVDRFFYTAHILQLKIPHARQGISSAICETLRVNRLAEGYIRPIAFIGEGAMGLYATDNPVRTVIAAWPWGAYLGEEALQKGIRARISSFARHHVNVSMTKAKTPGNYVNSILAKREAISDGYDEAILLDTEGYVSEASGENIFIVRDGVLKTPPLDSILIGITRDSTIRIAKDKGIEVREERFSRDEVYIADEVFLTGTAAEITPVREVDGRAIGTGRRGPVTEGLQKTFFEAAKGKLQKYEEWLTYL